MRFEDSYSWSLDKKLGEMEAIFKELHEKDSSLHLEQPHEMKYYTSVTQHALALVSDSVRQMLL